MWSWGWGPGGREGGEWGCLLSMRVCCALAGAGASWGWGQGAGVTGNGGCVLGMVTTGRALELGTHLLFPPLQGSAGRLGFEVPGINSYL